MTMSNEDWVRRCAEAEVVIEHVSAAFDIIPIWALEKDNQHWMPSVEALVLLKRAKDSIRDFEAVHFHGRQS